MKAMFVVPSTLASGLRAHCSGGPRGTDALVACLVLLAMLLPPFPVLAQQEGDAGGGTTGSFLYVYPTKLEYIVDRGYSEAITEQVMLFTPAVVSAGKTGRSGRVYAVYEPEVEVLSGFGEVNSVNHAAAVNFSWEPSRNVQLHGGGTLLKTNDPARRIPDSVVVLPRGELVETALFGGVTFQLGRFTSLEVRADQTISDLNAAEAFGALAVDHQGTAGTIALSRTVGRDKVLGVSYTLLKPRLLADEALKQDPDLLWVPPGEIQHHLSFAYGFALSSTTDVVLSAGAVYIDDTYPIGSAEVRRQARNYYLKVRYSRLAGQFAGFLTREEVAGQIPLPLPDGMLLKILSHQVAVEFEADLTDTIRLQHTLRGSRSAFAGIELDSFTLSGAVSVQFRTKDTVRPVVGFEYLGDGMSAGIRRRFITGVDINLWGPSSTAAEDHERARRNASLPYGHR